MFIAAAEQDFYRLTIYAKVEAISGSEMESGFKHTFTERPSIAQVSGLESGNTRLNPCPGLPADPRIETPKVFISVWPKK